MVYHPEVCQVLSVTGRKDHDTILPVLWCYLAVVAYPLRTHPDDFTFLEAPQACIAPETHRMSISDGLPDLHSLASLTMIVSPCDTLCSP